MPKEKKVKLMTLKDMERELRKDPKYRKAEKELAKEKKVKEMKPVKAWAVVNWLYCIYDPASMKTMTIFGSKQEAEQWKLEGPHPSQEPKVVPVLITPIKRKAGR